MIGEVIKEFKLTARLGKGGMGEVWVAEQQIVKTRVAIKLLLAEISSDTQHVQRFFNEAIAVSKIKHAGIVKIFDVGFHEGRAFLIMELLEGETLASRIARAGRLPVGQAAEIGRQIASILEATHAAGITHRDLKPDNVFLVPDAELASKERVKILDFGIAKLASHGTGLTATGGTMGTPAYMSPEQWNDAARADARADVYSLGCVAFEMMCGRPPFVAMSIGEFCTKHLTEAPPRATTLVGELPRELDDTIRLMLSKQPGERPAMREVGAVFAAVAARLPRALDPTLAPGDGRAAGGPATTLGAATGSRPAGGRGKTPLIAGVVATLAVAGGIVAYVATRGPSSDRDPGPAPPNPQPVGAPPPADAAAPAAPAANAWVRIDPPKARYVLGVDDAAPDAVTGFRAARKVMTPARPYAIQQHEVTWGELEPWLAAQHLELAPPAWARDPEARARLPVTGVTWSRALAYCRSPAVGGTLPTEEQWEYAARGPDHRPNPWGADPLDRQMTRVYAGPDAVPQRVMTSPQDQAPHAGGRVHDLIGNVQEWTLGLWRDDRPGRASFVQSGETSIRAIRGLPLAAPPAPIQAEAAAYRERLCATGPCVAKTEKLLAYIGFRCAKWLDR